MDDRKQITELYERMYQAMIDKDRPVLEEVHANDFVLVHMTGRKQSKKVYIDCIMDGTLNYYSAETEGLQITVDYDTAQLIGHSRVNAAVFGGGRSTWRLALRLQLRKADGQWRFTRAEASTY